MPKQIWNEGRVVGYSAYDIYLKQNKSEDPDGQPASEREWLAASLASGASLLYKLPAINAGSEDTHTVVDIILPEGSTLSAANTIVASFFAGNCASATYLDMYDATNNTVIGQGYMSRGVSNYGELIKTNLSGQLGPRSKVELNSDPGEMSEERRNQLRNYMKIVDGLVIQPGTWGSSTPKLKPDLDDNTGRPRIRLDIRGKIDDIKNSPWILFTGFTIRSVLKGITKLAPSSNVDKSQKNGDFLGPAEYPWANRIIFSVPNSYISYFASNAYKRKLPADSSQVLVQDSAVIDMKSPAAEGTNPAPVLENYYNTSMSTDVKLFRSSSSSQGLSLKRNARVPDAVSDYSTLGDGTAVLTVYQRKAIFPPALYGTFVDSKGTEYLHPIDVVSPGSVKMFYNDDGTTMKDYQQTFPGTNAINKTSDGRIEVLNNNDDKVPVAKVELLSFDGGNASVVQTTAGNTSFKSLAMCDSRNNNLPVNGAEEIGTDTASGDSIDYGHVSWRNLLRALSHNQYFNFSKILPNFLKPDSTSDPSITITTSGNNTTIGVSVTWLATQIKNKIQSMISVGKGLTKTNTSGGIKLESPLTAGTGVTLNSPSDGQGYTISSPLTAGTGVTLSGGSAGNGYTINSPLTAGKGISVSQSAGNSSTVTSLLTGSDGVKVTQGTAGTAHNVSINDTWLSKNIEISGGVGVSVNHPPGSLSWNISTVNGAKSYILLSQADWNFLDSLVDNDGNKFYPSLLYNSATEGDYRNDVGVGLASTRTFGGTPLIPSTTGGSDRAARVLFYSYINNASPLKLKAASDRIISYMVVRPSTSTRSQEWGDGYIDIPISVDIEWHTTIALAVAGRSNSRNMSPHCGRVPDSSAIGKYDPDRCLYLYDKDEADAGRSQSFGLAHTWQWSSPSLPSSGDNSKLPYKITEYRGSSSWIIGCRFKQSKIYDGNEHHIPALDFIQCLDSEDSGRPYKFVDTSTPGIWNCAQDGTSWQVSTGMAYNTKTIAYQYYNKHISEDDEDYYPDLIIYAKDIADGNNGQYDYWGNKWRIRDSDGQPINTPRDIRASALRINATGTFMVKSFIPDIPDEGDDG